MYTNIVGFSVLQYFRIHILLLNLHHMDLKNSTRYKHSCDVLLLDALAMTENPAPEILTVQWMNTMTIQQSIYGFVILASAESEATALAVVRYKQSGIK